MRQNSIFFGSGRDKESVGITLPRSIERMSASRAPSLDGKLSKTARVKMQYLEQRRKKDTTLRVRSKVGLVYFL